MKEVKMNDKQAKEVRQLMNKNIKLVDDMIKELADIRHDMGQTRGTPFEQMNEELIGQFEELMADVEKLRVAELHKIII